MKPKIIAIVGPTGSGKSDTAIWLCQHLNGEIVSMDSMQVYRGMDIGTAKPTRKQLSQAVHHLIDVAEPDERFTVSDYRRLAFEAINDILSRGKLPILVGGTGLYLNAVSYEMQLGESGADDALREELNRIAEEPGGPRVLHERLRKVDPISADRLHENDVRRVIRALEVYEQSGHAISDRTDETRKEGPYSIFVYGLTLPREQMYQRINERVDEMIAQGLCDEVKGLLARGIEPKKEGGSMQAIGYKEMVSALQGEMTMERAIDYIKQGSRRYAKRQWTWFRRDRRTQWFDWASYETKDMLRLSLLKKIQTDLRCALDTTR